MDFGGMIGKMSGGLLGGGQKPSGKDLGLGGILAMMGGGGGGLSEIMSSGGTALMQPGQLFTALGPLAGSLFAGPGALPAKAMGLPLPTTPGLSMLRK